MISKASRRRPARRAPAASCGATVSASFVVRNQGLEATDVPRWKDNVYLSLDNKISADDIKVSLEKQDNFEILEVKIELPDGAR